jgi:NAD(P)-dependent dehydrogenase (short-subunit alcohol dehydrogenase family)
MTPNIKPGTERIGLVTGANKGIGYEVARQLAASGCTVLMGARSKVLGEEAAAKLAAEHRDVHYVPIDLDNSGTITAAASKIDADFGHLDILVNNAGIAVDGDGLPSASSLEAIERDIRVNFIGTVALTQAMLPLLRKAPSARVVNVSSGLGSLTKTSDPAFQFVAYKYFGYVASKAALNPSFLSRRSHAHCAFSASLFLRRRSASWVSHNALCFRTRR